ncbi:hypothetical protein WJX73_003152 [Symbiochloris irregularis]|uniref:SET domain-containing protein n=1 Tax=Symbiochloris irregularis TaxID=706552 RepID=A0AAW1NPT1_9CHLO
MHEASLGKESFWHGYLSSLRREYLPLFWNEHELSLLQGTEADQRAVADRELTAQDYEQNIAPLLSKYPDRLRSAQMTLDLFHTVASWVASRAFGVDDYHGMSMVPFADAFNHKSSEASEQQGDDLEDQPPPKRPRITRGDLVPIEGRDAAAGAGLLLEIGICSAEKDGEGVLEVIAASDIPAGKEIENTYGELGNADLVNKYGFALRHNPFSVVQLDKATVVEAARQHMGKGMTERGFRRRKRFLEDESDLLEEEDEPFEVMPEGRVGPCLYAALRVLCASDAVFQGWRGIAEVLQPGSTGVAGIGSQAGEDSASAETHKQDRSSTTIAVRLMMKLPWHACLWWQGMSTTWQEELL